MYRRGADENHETVQSVEPIYGPAFCPATLRKDKAGSLAVLQLDAAAVSCHLGKVSTPPAIVIAR
jgi:hypothetical protein